MDGFSCSWITSRNGLVPRGAGSVTVPDQEPTGLLAASGVCETVVQARSPVKAGLAVCTSTTTLAASAYPLTGV